jgi:dsDNA-specific endonuclease/ATPase MutS2
LTQHREEIRTFLIQALENLAKELKRQNLLNVSIFTDELKLSLIAEMLIINRENIAFDIAKKLPLPESIIEKSKKIATYQDYEFIDNLINKNELISRELGISSRRSRRTIP